MSIAPASATVMTRVFLRNYVTRYRLAAPNLLLPGGCEADILGVRKSGFVDEIEIKISRGDFLADFRKQVQVRNPAYDKTKPHYQQALAGLSPWEWIPKHEALAAGRLVLNYFAFLLPTELAEQCLGDVPDHAGLYEFRPDIWDGQIRAVKRAPRLHGGKVSEQIELDILRKLSWRYWGQIVHAKDVA